MKSRLLPSLFVLVAALPASAAEVFKANNTTALSDSASWVSSGPPGTADVAVWDAPVASNTSPLGASMTWGGIKVVNPGGNITISPTDGATLSLASTGIDLSASTRSLTINAALTPVADQAWNVAASRSLTLAAQTGGAGVTITRTGDGTLNFNNTTVSVFAANLLLSGGTTRIVNGSGSQTFSGSISGSAALARTGNGTVVLSGNNAGFSGAFTISGSGPVHLAHASALGTATVNFNAANGAVLDNVSGAPLTLGAGASFILSNPLTFTGTHDLDLGASPISISGDRTLTVGAATLATAGEITAATGSLTKAGAGTLLLQPGAEVALSGKLAVTAGTLRISGGTVECGTSGAGNLDLAGGTLELAGGALTVRGITGTAGGGTCQFDGGVLMPLADSVGFFSGVSNAWVGGGAKLELDGYRVTIAQPLQHDSLLGDDPDGGLLVTDAFGGGTLTLAGTCSYTGPTVIESGTLALGAGGSIAASPVIEVRDEGVFDAGAGTTLADGQVLRGTGGVTGKLTVGAGATLSPGTTATPFAAMDMLDTRLVLEGTAEFDIRKTPPDIDQLVNLDRVTFGGTLKVTAAPGTFFANGDKFVLFDALTYAGAFAALDLPPLSVGLFWETDGLLTDGSIAVTDTLPKPTFSPPTGIHVGALAITINGVTGSTLHYTMDGSDPLTSPTVITASSPVTGIPVAVGATGFTLQAYASLPGFTRSTVATAVYTTLVNPTWSLDGSGNWEDEANWISGVVADGSGVTADFSTLTMTASATVTNGAARTIGGMIFGDRGEIQSWTVGGAGLTLAGPEQPVVTVANGLLTTNTGIQGTQGFTKAGAGQWTLNGDQPISGPIAVTGGTLRTGGGNSANGALGLASAFTIGNATVLCAGDNSLIGWGAKTSLPITLNPGGVLTCTNGSASNLWEIILVGGDFSSSETTHPQFGSWNVHKSIVATEDSTISARAIQFTATTALPAVQVAADKTVTVTGFFTNFNGNTVVRPLTKTGLGTLVMNGANTYTGATTVNEGTFGGSGSFTGSVTVAAGATLAPGAATNTTGTLTTGALTLAGTYQCQVEGANADRLTVNGNLVLTNSTLAISALGETEAGTRVIASYTDDRTGTFGGTLPAGYSVSYDDTAKEVRLTVPGGGDPYGAWAASRGLTAANNGKTQDPDGDGVSNLLEFYLNGDPLAANSAILPKVLAMDATTVTFGWTRLDAAESSVPVQNFQYGSTLAGWTNVPIGATGGPGPNGIVVNIAENDAAADSITVVIPRALAAGGKLFGRLYLSEQAP